MKFSDLSKLNSDFLGCKGGVFHWFQKILLREKHALDCVDFYK